MRWICEQSVGFELCMVDTNNIQKSLKEAYSSPCLSKIYKITENSKFSMIEHGGYFETYVNGEKAENFVKKYFLNKENQYEKYN